MSRQDKLYARLEILESEWEMMIFSELEKLSSEGKSKYITRYMGHYVSPAYSDKQTDDIERLEKDIYSLRIKLSLPTDEGPRAILEEFVARYRAGEGNVKGVSRKILKNLAGYQACLEIAKD